MNSPAQFLPTDDWIISSAKLRTIVGVGGIPLSVNRLICEIRASSWTVVRRCLCVDEASRRETDWPFHRRRRVLSTRPNFLAVASIFGRSCDSKLAIAWSIGAVVVVLFMVEEGKVVRSNFLKFGVVTGFGVSPGNPVEQVVEKLKSPPNSHAPDPIYSP